MTSPAADEDAAYTRRLGRALRMARQRLGLSLEMVEAATSGEFKASVLGAYERAQRNISVARLHRLARLYHVEVADLIPADPPVEVPPVVIDLRDPEPADVTPLP